MKKSSNRCWVEKSAASKKACILFDELDMGLRHEKIILLDTAFWKKSVTNDLNEWPKVRVVEKKYYTEKDHRPLHQKSRFFIAFMKKYVRL